MHTLSLLAFTGKLLACSALSIAVDLVDDIGVSLVQLRAAQWPNASTGASLPQPSAGNAQSSTSKPHIVFVLADDLGWNGVGYHQSVKSRVKTPFIDKFAYDGVKLKAYYAAAYCAPSRFAFLTGRAPWKSESGSGNFRAENPIGTNLGYVMLPEALKEAGYSTHLIGKWHQGFHMDAYLPTNRGFDTFYGVAGGCTHHFTQEITHEGGNLNCDLDGHSMRDIWEQDHPAWNYKSGDFGDDLYRARAVQLIKSHQQAQPFFLFLSLQAPHEPYEVPAAYASKYNLSEDENIYWGMHSHVDDTVQAVYNALNDADMYWNTLVIFTSDNGGNAHTYKEPYHSNYPLRGHKGELYEGAIRVPCFVNGGALPNSARGKTLSGLMAVEDWYATLGRLTGAPPRSGGPSNHDSFDNWDYIAGASSTSARSEVVMHYVGPGFQGSSYGMSILRTDEHKVVSYGESIPGCKAWEWGCRKCTPLDPCVYNVEEDPGETTDISKHLQAMLKNYMIPRMQSSWEAAYQQNFFGTGIPGSDEARQNKACEMWKDQGGFLRPWAISEDESNFVTREFSVKVNLTIAFDVNEFSTLKG